MLTLRDKVGNLVTNYDLVNNSIEEKLKLADTNYKIKKDLKRLKFISDLPHILEKQLSQFLSDPEKKDLKLLEKSLNYYEKCSEFLILHKNNVFFYLSIVFSQWYFQENK